MYQFGPYGPNHATAGTFAFKKELLKQHRYNDDAALAEEKEFLKNYTVPFVQLEPKKTILVFSHLHNTFDKKTLLDNPNPSYTKESDKTVDDFIKEEDFKDFFTNKIDSLLKNYEPGKPEMKPDVLSQIGKIKQEREEQMKQAMMNRNTQEWDMLKNMGISETHIQELKNNPQEISRIIHQNQIKISCNQMLLKLLFESGSIGNTGQISREVNGKTQNLTNREIVVILEEQNKAIIELQEKCNSKDELIRILQEKVN
jgi:hypothetical protein